ncbi:MAG: ATP-binding protein [Alphaproteobacteria bacterium]|nr:MAG: ATP-binding protein [Alphaproteobacteria bacterium]
MNRDIFFRGIQKAFEVHPIVGLLGPRQCGKTTLARQYISHFPDSNYFDLEDPEDLSKLEHPKRALENLEGLIVIDEVQKRPKLFELLRVLVDRPNNKAKFLILGSASRDLLMQSSETLAGRIEYIELPPFSLFEVDDMRKLWLRGGYPKAYLADTNEQATQWIKAYEKTFLERDIPSFGFQIAPSKMRRFWMMLAHYHGQIMNASEIGNSLDISHKTVKHYVDILSDTLMIRVLQPWHENIKKRQVKMPKIYFRDSGVFHYLLGIKDIYTHPKMGASWEGFALEQIIRIYQLKGEDHFYFWAVHSGAELDLLIIHEGRRIGFEFKMADAPRLTHSMKVARDLLKLDQLYVVYPGEKSYFLDEGIDVVPLLEWTTL